MKMAQAGKVLIAINFDEGLFNFRRELLLALIEAGYEVHVAVPRGEYCDRIRQIGCQIHDTSLNRRGTNPLQELALLRRYGQILGEVQPQVVLTYTIKPNIYLGFLCGKRGIPYYPTITGLGTAVAGEGLLQQFTRRLYRAALGRARAVFFQNQENEALFDRLGIACGRHRMLPGSGVNLERFCLQPYPQEPEFLFISRVMEEKGIEQFLDAAQAIHGKYPETRFRILGFLEEEYKGKARLDQLIADGTVLFEGSVEDVIPYLRNSQCTLHPSFYPEGMSNVCLESAACGRPVITTDRSGCRETVRDGETGYLIPERDSSALISRIETFLALSYEERRSMGQAARAYMEETFDRQIVVARYLEAIREVCCGD